MAEARARGGPEAEGAVDVEPGACVVRTRRRSRQRVEGAGVDVAGLRADDRRPVAAPRAPRRAASARMRPCSSAANELERGGAEPEQAQRAVDRHVALVAQRGRGSRGAPCEAVALDVPARARSTWCRAAARAVVLAPCAPVTKPLDTPAGRPSSSASQPAGDLLGGRGGGRGGDREAVLVPRGREPVGSDAAGSALADDEAEVAAGLRADEPRLGGGDELRDHLRVLGACRRAAARRARRPAPSTDARARTGRSSSVPWNAAGMVGGEPEDVAHGVHSAPR